MVRIPTWLGREILDLPIRLTGTRPRDVLTPGQRAAYRALGFTMAIVALVHWMCARMFFTLVFNAQAMRDLAGADGLAGGVTFVNHLGYALPAAVWAMFVYALELSITSQTASFDVGRAKPARWRRDSPQLHGRWGRVAVAAVFGVIISELLVQLLFAPSLTRIIVATQTAANQKALNFGRQTISGAEAGGVIDSQGRPVGLYADMLNRRAELERAWNSARQRLACEQNGNRSDRKDDPNTTVDCVAFPGSGTPNFGPKAQQRSQELDQAWKALGQWDADNGQALRAMNESAAKTQARTDDLTRSAQEAVARDDGLGPRIEASIDYLRERPAVRVPTRLVLLLAGLLLDLVPLIVKLGLLRSAVGKDGRTHSGEAAAARADMEIGLLRIRLATEKEKRDLHRKYGIEFEGGVYSRDDLTDEAAGSIEAAGDRVYPGLRLEVAMTSNVIRSSWQRRYFFRPISGYTAEFVRLQARRVMESVDTSADADGDGRAMRQFLLETARLSAVTLIAGPLVVARSGNDVVVTVLDEHEDEASDDLYPLDQPTQIIERARARGPERARDLSSWFDTVRGAEDDDLDQTIRPDSPAAPGRDDAEPGDRRSEPPALDQRHEADAPDDLP
ncbi:MULTISPECIES: DUF4407 domain-containing protein [unclassified Frankia]|uniref:DUF4407 domain-containing protein n=1 Tax=unclassified Frankia TaxID=2632575 RepID=UPI001EF5CF41|nr:MULTISPECIES: DUF4407 domain-containing protein [unclassified Frankia]